MTVLGAMGWGGSTTANIPEILAVGAGADLVTYNTPEFTDAGFVFPTGSPVLGVAINPAKTILAYGHGGLSPFLRLFEMPSWTPIAGPNPSGGPFRPRFSRDGTLFCAPYSNIARIYNVSDWSSPGSTTLSGVPTCCSFLPDDSKVAVGHNGGTGISIITVSTLTIGAGPVGTGIGVPTGVTFSPDGAYLAMSGPNTPFVRIFNTSDWSVLPNPSTLPAGAGKGIAFSPDGAYLAIAHTTTPFVTIYNTSDWSKVANPATLPNSNASDVAFNASGNLMTVGGSVTPFITTYNVADWSKVADPTPLTPNGTTHLAYSYNA